MPDSYAMLPRGSHEAYRTTRGTQGLAVSIIFTCLATCFVAARLYTRVKLVRHMEPNDWMIVIALINSFVFMGFYVVEVVNGMGMHIADIPPRDPHGSDEGELLCIPQEDST
ncbi:hypothetical protein AWENTII_002643 [Aspergillus wentii]